MGKSRAKAEEEEKKKLKKERIRKALILAAIGLAVLIVYLIIACMPLDEMTDYRVCLLYTSTMTATGCTREEAKAALSEADGHVKTAIVMILLGCGAKEAKTHLEAAGGHVRNAL